MKKYIFLTICFSFLFTSCSVLHKSTNAAFFETQAERSFIKTINGNCYSPISVSANVIDNKTLSIEAYIINTKGTEMITDKIEGHKTDAITTGELLAKKLIKKGAKKLLKL